MDETSSPSSNDDQQPLCMDVAEQVVQELAEMYEMLGLEKGGKDFGTEVYFPMLKSRPNPLKMEKDLEDRVVSNLDLMKLSCAYAVLALVNGKLGDHENAWVAVGYARYWSGVAYGTGVMAGQTSMKYKTRSSLGGKARAEKYYGKVKEEACRLAEKYLDYNATYAAEQIRDDVVQFQKDFDQHYALGEAATVRRIAGWLQGMNFKGKHGPRKPNVKS